MEQDSNGLRAKRFRLHDSEREPAFREGGFWMEGERHVPAAGFYRRQLLHEAQRGPARAALRESERAVAAQCVRRE
jgi:hypothetical protein